MTTILIVLAIIIIGCITGLVCLWLYAALGLVAAIEGIAQGLIGLNGRK